MSKLIDGNLFSQHFDCLYWLDRDIVF